MNPPSTDDNDNGYSGSEPLDTALADRFAFVVEMPTWAQLSEAEQLAVIRATDSAVDPQAALALQAMLATIRSALPALEHSLGTAVAEYVRVVAALLPQAGIPLSPRRTGMLFRTVLAVHAAALTVDPRLTASDCTYLALRCSLPQRAQGLAINATKLLAAHREAWRLAGIKPNDPLRAILLTADPVERLRLSIAAPSLPKGEFSGIVADALAQRPKGAHDAAIVCLFETDAAGRLNAAVAEQVAQRYRAMAVFPQFSETLHATSSRFKTWSQIKNLLSRLDPASPADHLRANALAASFARAELATPEEAERAFEAYDITYGRLRAA
jgi:hypothetical protein